MSLSKLCAICVMAVLIPCLPSFSQSYDDSCMISGHKYVDLGLPSGLLWSSCNLGASSPEGYGSYFAWGETSEKDNYSWENLKYCLDAEGNCFSKYVSNPYEGNPDYIPVLDPADDPARTLFGGNWRMPTCGDFMELKQHCKWTWTETSGVKGYIIEGSNGNSIFIPAGGLRNATDLNGAGEYGYLWSSSFVNEYSKGATLLGFNSAEVDDRCIASRYYGLPVRPVSDNPLNISRSVIITAASGTIAGHAYVDLGLPSGIKWAYCNVGSESPSDPGSYFSWGEVQVKSVYDATTYHKQDNKGHIAWEAPWRMPTDHEAYELMSECVWLWTTINEVNGYKVCGPNGNSIFLLAAGLINGSECLGYGLYGYYWDSFLFKEDKDEDEDDTGSSGLIDFNQGRVGGIVGVFRCFGLSVRAVVD